MEPARDVPTPLAPFEYLWLTPRRKFQDRVWRHTALLALTILTTTYSGAGHYASFLSDIGTRDIDLTTTELLVNGLWYSGTILLILGFHEFGHYFACRYYDVDASLPFFIPAPLPLTGTLGAFIRIREPIGSKRMLFDIGIAGPIAGFVVAVPALFIGLMMSNVVEVVPSPGLLTLGEPLIFQWAAQLLFGAQPDHFSVNLHPVGFAAWFGLLATALNLFPIGQLDGGHISYAVLGRKSSWVTLGMVVMAVVLTYFSMSWIVWTTLMIVMLVVFGRHHPRTYDEDIPLDRGRILLAVFAVVMFVLCFTPSPIGPSDLLNN